MSIIAPSKGRICFLSAFLTHDPEDKIHMDNSRQIKKNTGPLGPVSCHWTEQ